MTWTKLGSEFIEDCASVGLSDAGVRTHVEGIAWIYTTERTDCLIPKQLVRRFAGSDDFGTAIAELVNHGWWVDAGGCWEVRHHADVIRQSLAAQVKQRERSKKSSANYRAKHSEDSGTDKAGTTEVTGHVTYHADRQTDKQLESDPTTTCEHGYHPGREADPWVFVAACDQCQMKAGRKSA